MTAYERVEQPLDDDLVSDSQPAAGMEGTVEEGQLADLTAAVADDSVARADLKALQDAGKFTDTDSNGQQLVTMLSNYLQGPSLLDPREMVKQIVHTLAHPEQVFQGDHTTTCAAASLETILASEKPAEFARIAVGLLSNQKVQLQSGNALSINRGAPGTDGGRNALDDLMQGSFKAYGRQFAETGVVAGDDGDDDGFGGGRLAGSSKFGGGKLGGKRKFGGDDVGSIDGDGLTPGQIDHMYQDVMGRQTLAVGVDASDKSQVLDAMKAALHDGLKIPVGVTGHDDKGNATNHMVTLVGIKDGPPPVARYTDSSSHKVQKMSLADFLGATKLAILPTKYTDLLKHLQKALKGDTNLSDFVGKGSGSGGGSGSGAIGGSGGRTSAATSPDDIFDAVNSGGEGGDGGAGDGADGAE